MPNYSPNYYVLQVSRCPICDGTGRLQSPDWERYWEEYDVRFPHGFVDPDELTAFNREFWGVQDPALIDEITNADDVCPECDGAGSVEDRIPLEQALRQLGIRVETGK